MRRGMELRSLLPRPFPERGGDGAGDGDEGRDGETSVDTAKEETNADGTGTTRT